MGFDPMCVTAKRVLGKLGGDKETKTQMPHSEIKLTYDDTDGAYCARIDPAPFVPVAATEYTVKWNGEVYKSVGTASSTAIYIGNLEPFTGIDTGEPFLMAYHEGVLSVFDLAATSDETVTLKVSAETIVPIDPKYLPGVCLPVVELNIDAFIDEGTFTDAENAALTACIGMPFILKSVNSTLSTSIVMSYAGSGNEHEFSNGNMTLYTNNGGTTWTVINA